MGHFESDMALLRERFPDLHDRVSTAVDDGSVETVVTGRGECVPAMVRNGRHMFMYSKL